MTNIEPLSLLQLEELSVSVPSLRLLKQAKTETQQKIWIKIRCQGVYTALYWMGMQEGLGDLLKPCVISGVITQQAYDQAVLSYDMYLHWWILCVRAEESVKAECRSRNIPYPFKNPYELFLKTVQEKGDYVFSLCLSHRSFSARKSAEALRLVASRLEGETWNEEQEKLLKSLSPETSCDVFWVHLVQKVASKAGKKSHLGRALNYYYRACADTGLKMSAFLSKGHSIQTTKDGLMKGSRYGGKYEPIS